GLLSIHATEEALDAARERGNASDPLIAEIAGRLVGQLQRAGRTANASQRLSSIEASFPGIQLTEGGVPVDMRALRAQLASRLEALNRRPVIGARLGTPTVLTGWRLVMPAGLPAAPPLTDHVMMESQDGEMAMWQIGDGGLTRRWGGVRTDETLLRLDESGAWFVRPLNPNQAEQNFTVLRRDVQTGTITFATLGFEEALAHDVVAPIDFQRRVQRFSTPLRPDVSPTQIMFDSDEDTIVLVERVGRVAAYDLTTGALLWSRARTMDRVHDATLAAGTLLIGGADVSLDGELPLNSNSDGMTHLLLAIDVRTGDTLFRQEESRPVRWVAISPENRGLLGSEDGVAAFDLFRGTELWRLETGEVSRSKAAWPVAGRVLVLNEGDWLWQINTVEGTLGEDSFDTRDRLDGVIPWIVTYPLGDNVAIASLHGLMVFDPEGSLVGVSLPGPRNTIQPPAFARDHIVTIERDGTRLEDAPLNGFTLNVYAGPSCRIVSSTVLELGLNPDAVDVVDNAIIVSAGWATAVIPTSDGPVNATPSPREPGL
ncbi:MAG: PQQ-binding-like beta-propeller repeat protein, partial [Phycisphaerales bacterium]|nr:PQQ-binding-like beta-propeller repeat protein [Phycisphaerales bacterium]